MVTSVCGLCGKVAGRGLLGLCALCRSRELARIKRHSARALLTVDQWARTLRRFNYRCAYCGGDFQVLEHFNTRGPTSVANCVPACRTCNTSKGDRPALGWKLYGRENVSAAVRRVARYLARKSGG